MTGRLGYVRPISWNPAVVNMANVPVNSAAPDTFGDRSWSMSTGCPSSIDAPCSRACFTAAVSKAVPTPPPRYSSRTAKHVTHQAFSSSLRTRRRARLFRTPGTVLRGTTRVHPAGSSSTYARSPIGMAAVSTSRWSATRLLESVCAQNRWHQHESGFDARLPKATTTSFQRSCVAVWMRMLTPLLLSAVPLPRFRAR